MRKLFRIIWIVLALAVLVGGLILVLKFSVENDWQVKAIWKMWVIWCAACAVLNIFQLLINFLSKFRGCLGTVLFLVLSIALAPLHVVYNIVSNIVALVKKE